MNTQELLWKYAEGLCSEPENAAVEKLLETDENLREELALIREIQTALTGMKAEQPSMRFTQNVMESLPKKLYTSPAPDPLLPPFLKGIFWAVVVGAILSVVFAAKPGDPAGIQIPYLDRMAAGLESATRLISPDMVSYAVFVLVALAVLTVFDRLLARGNWQAR